MVLYKKILELCSVLRAIFVIILNRFHKNFETGKYPFIIKVFLKTTVKYMCIGLVARINFVICECFDEIAFLNFYLACMGSTIVENTTVIFGFPNNCSFNSVILRAVTLLEIALNTRFTVIALPSLLKELRY